MGFRDDIRGFIAEVQVADRATFVAAASLALESIVEGSPFTGAPGQPVDTGALKASWHLDFTESQAAITTPLGYAPVIEDDLRSSFDRSGRSAAASAGGTWSRPPTHQVDGRRPSQRRADGRRHRSPG
jgi:hypothetical protein